MRRVVAAAVLFLMLSAFLFPPPSVAGWGQARWGMTVEQVISSGLQHISRQKSGNTQLQIHSYIDDNLTLGLLYFDKGRFSKIGFALNSEEHTSSVMSRLNREFGGPAYVYDGVEDNCNVKTYYCEDKVMNNDIQLITKSCNLYSILIYRPLIRR